jgi:hypothetical protein
MGSYVYIEVLDLLGKALDYKKQWRDYCWRDANESNERGGMGAGSRLIVPQYDYVTRNDNTIGSQDCLNKA